jgi:hypothetical protein
VGITLLRAEQGAPFKHGFAQYNVSAAFFFARLLYLPHNSPLSFFCHLTASPPSAAKSMNYSAQPSRLAKSRPGHALSKAGWYCPV